MGLPGYTPNRPCFLCFVVSLERFSGLVANEYYMYMFTRLFNSQISFTERFAVLPSPLGTQNEGTGSMAEGLSQLCQEKCSNPFVTHKKLEFEGLSPQLSG